MSHCFIRNGKAWRLQRFASQETCLSDTPSNLRDIGRRWASAARMRRYGWFDAHTFAFVHICLCCGTFWRKVLFVMRPVGGCREEAEHR